VRSEGLRRGVVDGWSCGSALTACAGCTVAWGVCNVRCLSYPKRLPHGVYSPSTRARRWLAGQADEPPAARFPLPLHFPLAQDSSWWVLLEAPLRFSIILACRSCPFPSHGPSSSSRLKVAVLIQPSLPFGQVRASRLSPGPVTRPNPLHHAVAARPVSQSTMRFHAEHPIRLDLPRSPSADTDAVVG
jgi:hypothetical protein